jgi:hypothetical protein
LKKAPVGSRSTAIRPCSATSNGASTIAPPAAATAAAASSALATAT